MTNKELEKLKNISNKLHDNMPSYECDNEKDVFKETLIELHNMVLKETKKKKTRKPKK